MSRGQITGSEDVLKASQSDPSCLMIVMWHQRQERAVDVPQLVERIRTGQVHPVDAPTEEDYYRAWVQGGVSDADPFTTAVVGGAMADRLAWVFLAGYQATITRCFPELAVMPGWRSFVNTEDRRGILSGTSLLNEDGARRLYGWKTWVAASAHVDELMVSAKQNEPPFIVVPRAQAGVHIDDGTPKAYLTEMVQGTVRFDGVEVADSQIVGDETTFSVFRASEGAYVRVALTAFILSHAIRLGGDATLVGGAISGLLGASAILRLPVPSAIASLAVAGADSHTTWLASEFEAFIQERDEELSRRWLRDNRLVHGASAGIAARADAALDTWRQTAARPT